MLVGANCYSEFNGFKVYEIKNASLSKQGSNFVIDLLTETEIKELNEEPDSEQFQLLKSGRLHRPDFSFAGVADGEEVYGEVTVLNLRVVGGLSQNNKRLPAFEAEVRTERGEKVKVVSWSSQHYEVFVGFGKVILGSAVFKTDDRYKTQSLVLLREAIVTGVTSRLSEAVGVDLDAADLSTLFK